MAHEITSTDGLALHKTAAWHGLGTVIPDDFTPRQGLEHANIDWGVEQRFVWTFDESGNRVLIPSVMANYRADTRQFFGTVSAGYQVVQNWQMADFCEALLGVENGKVFCESVGSIRGGAMVWFLLKGTGFQVGRNDLLYPYICVSNGHDGDTTFRITPATIRVVCSNTLHAAVPGVDGGERLGSSAMSIRHYGNIMERIDEARKALLHYGETLEKHKAVINTLTGRAVDSAAVQKFFLESYTADFGDIPDNPTTRIEENRKNRALSAFSSFSRRFDDEKGIAGANYWNALNSYTGVLQHDRKARGRDDEDRVGRRVESNLFGLSQERTQAALNRAYRAALST